MKEKIKEIQDYFREKLLKGEFEITKRERFTYTVLIDKEYKFEIWMSNGSEHRKLYCSSIGTFMYFDLTKKQALKLHSLLLSDYNQFMKESLIESKKKALEKLQKEIDYLCQEK